MVIVLREINSMFAIDCNVMDSCRAFPDVRSGEVSKTFDPICVCIPTDELRVPLHIATSVKDAIP